MDINSIPYYKIVHLDCGYERYGLARIRCSICGVETNAYAMATLVSAL